MSLKSELWHQTGLMTNDWSQGSICASTDTHHCVGTNCRLHKTGKLVKYLNNLHCSPVSHYKKFVKFWNENFDDAKRQKPRKSVRRGKRDRNFLIWQILKFKSCCNNQLTFIALVSKDYIILWLQNQCYDQSQILFEMIIRIKRSLEFFSWMLLWVR